MFYFQVVEEIRSPEIIIDRKPTLIKWGLGIIGIAGLSLLLAKITGMVGFLFVGVVLLIIGMNLSLSREYIYVSIDAHSKTITIISNRFFMKRRLTYSLEGGKMTYGLRFIRRTIRVPALVVKNSYGFSMFQLTEDTMGGLTHSHLNKIVECIERSGNVVIRQDQIRIF